MANRSEQLSEAWRLAPYTASQQRAIRSAVIQSINSTDACPTLRQFAQSAGVSGRGLRRHFGRRKALFEAVIESVLERAITIARGGHVSARTVDGTIDALVWHRLSVYEAVAPIMPAVRAQRAGLVPFAALVHAVSAETEFLVRRVLNESRAAPCKALLAELDETLSLLRLDDLRQGCEMSPPVVSELLRSDVAAVFAARGAGCLQQPDPPRRTSWRSGSHVDRTDSIIALPASIAITW